MNVHPVLIHFPIALFSLYGIMELVPFKKIVSEPYWFYAKAILAISSALGAAAAVLAGDGAVEAVANGSVRILTEDPGRIIELHEDWAHASLIIFSVIAVAYLVVWTDKIGWKPEERLPFRFLKIAWQKALALSISLIETRLIVVLAVLGLITITVTGALGGSMIYGPDSDPVIKLVYNLLVR